MRTIFVEKNKKNLNLINYIIEVFPSLPKNYIHKALRNKDIKVNNLRVNKDVNIFFNDKIDIYIDDKILFNLPKEIDIVFEDENLLAINIYIYFIIKKNIYIFIYS
jgi:23S rRNA-/tRNA-specific pseudouridylate synthase